MILCTGFSESLDVIRARTLGIKACLHKPLGVRELLAAVARVLYWDTPGAGA